MLFSVGGTKKTTGTRWIFSVEEENVAYAKEMAAARGMIVTQVKISAVSAKHAEEMVIAGKAIPPPANPGDIRNLTFADTSLLFEEVRRHWAKDAVLGRYPLVLSNPPPGSVTTPPKQPPVPFGRVSINPSYRFGLTLSFTIWHDDDQVLAGWESIIRKFFTVEALTFEGHIFNAHWSNYSNLMPLGMKYADENGVVPYILGLECRLTTEGMGDKQWRLFVVG